MTQVTSAAAIRTAADLLRKLGDIPPERVWIDPVPGTATEKDVLAIEARENRLCELVDGVLVEKTVGYYESLVAGLVVHFLNRFVIDRDLGIALGADGTLRILPGTVRIPDACFISWDKLPGRKLPAEPIPDLVPDLAIEILSAGNTKKEMQRKLREYFEAGVSLVWFIDPASRIAEAYRSRTAKTRIGPDGILSGDPILPGFQLSLQELFAHAGRRSKEAGP
jgi:Uma2 family endonuclease